MSRSTFKSLSEAELARFQTLQTGNDCVLHAISSAIQILTMREYKPQTLIQLANRLWWRGRFFRIVPGGGIMPPMQVGFLRYLIKREGLLLDARLLHLSPEVLRNLPHDDQMAALITIYWQPKRNPGIYLGSSNHNYNLSPAMSGHTMLFSAFDPDHRNEGVGITPWGFINSWANGGTELFWMTDEDFRRTWHFPLPIIGNNSAVIISTTERNSVIT